MLLQKITRWRPHACVQRKRHEATETMERALLFVLVTLLAALVPTVSAFDAGDAIALVLGLVIGILGIFACLGYYARRKASS